MILAFHLIKSEVIKIGYTHGKKWTDNLVESEIISIMDVLGIKTFPTHSEMQKVEGHKGLCNKISKSGGTKFWANKMNLPIKECETEFGNKYELLAIENIKNNLSYNSELMKPGYPYDILVENSVKIDTKVSKQIFTNCHTWQNTFNLEKKNPTCDIYIFYCLTNNGEHLKTVIVPSSILQGKTQVGIGKNSKYNQYIDKWDIISDYMKFYEFINDKYKRMDIS
jgi:hypothetical protein